jgi:hypothetical protein
MTDQVLDLTTAQWPLLDMAADYIESLCAAIGLPCKIVGGTLHESANTIEMEAEFACNPIAYPQRCRTLSSRLRDTFCADDAGVDVDGASVWVCGMSDTRRLGRGIA